jgi:predicted chitinase
MSRKELKIVFISSFENTTSQLTMLNELMNFCTEVLSKTFLYITVDLARDCVGLDITTN